MSENELNAAANAEEGVIEDALLDKYLTFPVGNDIYGIEIRYVTEIVPVLPITVVPGVPDFLTGIVNLRGKIIPVIDMHLKFGRPSVEYNDRTSIIVLDIEDISVGIIVDEVEAVIEIKEDNIVPPPSFKSSAQTQYIRGVGKVNDEELKLLLDLETLLNLSDFKDMDEEA